MATILLIDDSCDYAEFLAETLRRQGHAVIKAEDGKEGLRHLDGVMVDLVITDIFMPKADGIELIRSMRRRHPSLPVIGVTGGYKGLEGPVMECMIALGAHEVFQKTAPVERLLQTVARLVGQSADAPALAETA